MSSASSLSRSVGNSVRGLSGSSQGRSMATTRASSTLTSSAGASREVVVSGGSATSTALGPRSSNAIESVDATAVVSSKSNCSPFDLLHGMRMTASCRGSSMCERASQNWALSLAKSQEIQCAPSASHHLLSGFTDGFNFRQSPLANERPGRGRTVRPSWQRDSECDRAEGGFVRQLVSRNAPSCRSRPRCSNASIEKRETRPRSKSFMRGCVTPHWPAASACVQPLYFTMAAICRISSARARRLAACSGVSAMASGTRARQSGLDIFLNSLLPSSQATRRGQLWGQLQEAET